MNQRENEHLKMVEQLNQDHFAELATKDDKMKQNEREYNDSLTAKEKKHLGEVKYLNT